MGMDWRGGGGWWWWSVCVCVYISVYWGWGWKVIKIQWLGERDEGGQRGTEDGILSHYAPHCLSLSHHNCSVQLFIYLLSFHHSSFVLTYTPPDQQRQGALTTPAPYLCCCPTTNTCKQIPCTTWLSATCFASLSLMLCIGEKPENRTSKHSHTLVITGSYHLRDKE